MAQLCHPRTRVRFSQQTDLHSYRPRVLKKTLLALVSLLSLIAVSLTVPTTVQAGDFTLATAPGAIAWSPDGQYAYFSPATQTVGTGVIKRLDLSNGNVTDILTMSDPYGCHAHVTALAVTPDNTTLLAGGYSCAFTIPLSNPAGFTTTSTWFDWAQQISVGADAAYMVGSRNGMVYKITKSGGTWGPSWVRLGGDSWTARSLAVSPDGATVYVGKESGEVRVINTSTGAETALAGSVSAYAVAVAPDGSYLLVTDGTRTLRKVQLTGASAGTVTAASYGDENGMREMVIDPTGTYAYVGSIYSRSLVKIRTSDLTVANRLSFTAAYPSLSADTPSDLAASPSASRAGAADEVLVSSSALSRIIQLPATPYAPSSLSVTPGDDSATISFTAADSGMSPVTNHEYRLNGSGSWTALSPADATSPVTITGLTNGTAVGIELRAVNAQGSGTASSSVTVTPQSTPRAPRSVSITPASGRISISFTAPESDGGFPVTNYEVSTDGGSTWQTQSPAVTSGPITVTGLTNGVQYLVSLRAVNALGSGTGSTPVAVTPNVASSGGGSPVRAPDPTPSATPTPTPTPTSTATPTVAPAQVVVPQPVAVGEGLVVVDGRATKVAVKAVEGRKWQVQGEDFSLEFIPQALAGELDGSFTARAGAKVLVRGDGFAPGTLIASYLPGAWADSLGQSTVESDGTFEVNAMIPASLRAGQYVFQVNGLGTATTVRSVNLGMQLLPALRKAAKATSIRVTFPEETTRMTSSSTSALGAFVKRNGTKSASALIVPVVGAQATTAQAALARQRALAVKQTLVGQGFTKPIRVASGVRRVQETKARTGTMVWLRLR